MSLAGGREGGKFVLVGVKGESASIGSGSAKWLVRLKVDIEQKGAHVTHLEEELVREHQSYLASASESS